MCLGMLYPIIEVFRSDADFAEDLSESIFTLLCYLRKSDACPFSSFGISPFTVGMDPPLPIYFLSLMSNLGNRSAKNYPSKKVWPNPSTQGTNLYLTFYSSFLSRGKYF